jgi:PAS domain S-box-containing protein
MQLKGASVFDELEMLYRNAGVALGLIDRDLRFVRVNELLAEINGVSVADHDGRTLREVLPEMADHLAEIYRPVLERGEPVVDMLVRGETPAQPGVPRVWRNNYLPFRSEKGEVIGLLAVIREVTETERLKDELQDARYRFERAVEASNLGIWDWMVESGHVWFSDRWQTMLGYAPGEVEANISSWEEAVHPDDWPAINAALQPHLDGLTPEYSCEHRVRCKDGGWLWIHDRGRVVERDPAGKPLRMVGTHDDIQQRKDNEDVRERLTALSHGLVQLDNVDQIVELCLIALLGYLDADMAGFLETGKDGEPPRMMRRWRDGLLGVSAGKWMGGRLDREAFALLGRGETVNWPDISKEAFMQGEAPGSLADGRDVHAMLAVPHLGRGRLDGATLAANRQPRAWTPTQVHFIEGVRDRMREAKQRARAELERKSAQAELGRISRLNEMSVLASTLAHELNQPLTAANNYLMVARIHLSKMEGGQAAQAGEAVGLATRQITNAGEIIRRMRAFTASGHVTLRRCAITSVVDDALDVTLAGLAPARVIFRKHYAENLPDPMVDPVQIQQVLSNLIRNAVEAMRDTPEPVLDIRVAHENGHIRITLSDNGVGLTDAVMETLFQPFKSSKNRGLGLGLSLCRTIVEAHDGTLVAAQRPEGGASFTIELPVTDTAPGV